LGGKTLCIKNLLGLKIDCMETLLILKNCLSWKIAYNEKLLVFQTICIQKLLGLKKLFILKNRSRHPKRGNHKKYGIGSFHIYVQCMYTKSIVERLVNFVLMFFASLSFFKCVFAKSHDNVTFSMGQKNLTKTPNLT
jgi:hypothetical protein